MGRTALLWTVVALALIGGTVVALAWWSLADKFFPGANRSTGQGVPRTPRSAGPKPTVVKELDGSSPAPPAA